MADAAENTNREPSKQERRFKKLSAQVGVIPALFYFCAVFNVPYMSEFATDSWDEYVETIAYERRDKKTSTFADGETDINEIIRSNMDDPNRWLKVWGTGDADNPYTEEDYRELDEHFMTYSSRVRQAGGMDAQQEDTFRVCSRLALLRDKSIAKGDKESMDMAAKADNMIQKNLESENLRKRDEKPMDDVRVDGIAAALEKKYGLDNDMMMNREAVIEMCCKWLMSHNYPTTLDAAHQMTLAIINATRRNNDEPEMGELPPHLRFKDNYSEFAEKPSEMEKEAYKHLGLSHGMELNE